MRSSSQLRQPRIGNHETGKKAPPTGATRLALLRGRAFWAAPFVTLCLAVLIGLSASPNPSHLWSGNATLMAAEPAPPAPPPPQGYQPSFRDLAGITGGALRADLMSSMKIGAIRIGANWENVEPARGQWNWKQTDSLIGGAVSQHYEVLALLAFTAPWASSGPGLLYPPKNPADWTDYVTAVVTRYMAAPYNVRYFEVWNEPTKAAGFWKGTTDLQWVDVIYLPAAKIIRDHGARVVFGGWPDGALPEFDQELQYKNSWQLTDIINVHYFGLPVIQQLYAKWVATGKCKGVWETEVGAVNNPVYLTNLYGGMFNWARTSGNWTFPDQYKLFWYPPVGAGCPTCLATKGADGKQVATANGLALEKLAQSLP
jgi:hypothetical protein